MKKVVVEKYCEVEGHLCATSCPFLKDTFMGGGRKCMAFHPWGAILKEEYTGHSYKPEFIGYKRCESCLVNEQDMEVQDDS